MWVTHETKHIVREFQLTKTNTSTNTAILIKVKCSLCDFHRLYTVFCGRSSWNLVCESRMGRHISCVNYSALTHTRTSIQLHVYVILIDFTQFFVVDRYESRYVNHTWVDTHLAWILGHSHTHAHQYSYMCMWFRAILHSFLWPIELKVGMWITHGWTHILREF